MSKPSSVLSWATTGGARLVPSGGELAAGFAVGDKPPARHMNHLWGLAGDWTAYLNDLHNEAAFLGEDYAWIGNHEHAGDVVLSGASNEVAYGAPRSFHRYMVPVASQGSWTYDSLSFSVKTSTPSADYHAALDVPVGATLTNIAVGCRQPSGGSGGAGSLSFAVGAITCSAGVSNAPVSVGVVNYVSGSAWTSLASAPVVALRSLNAPFVLRATSSSSAAPAAVDEIGWITWSFTLPNATGHY
jgi:hypothetical protein